METQSFAIVNLKEGLRTDRKPFVIDNDAFPTLFNAYLFRGRIQRRSSTSYLGSNPSRLRWQIGTTGVNPFTVTLPDIPIGIRGVQFSIGSVFFTDNGQGGAPAPLLSTTNLYTGALNRATGQLQLNHPVIAPTPVYYYPQLPAMGLRSREKDEINFEDLWGFDTRYSYQYSNGAQAFIGNNVYKESPASVVLPIFTWSGTDSDFFWTTNYQGALFATNNVASALGYTPTTTGPNNVFSITAGANAVNTTLTIGAGHNVQINDYVVPFNTPATAAFNGRAFQVTGIAAATVTINNPVAPGAVVASGWLHVLNRQTNVIANSIQGDGIKWCDVPASGGGWVNFSPPLTDQIPQRVLVGGLCIIAYKDRLLVFNTKEYIPTAVGNTGSVINFKQRCRWSQNGTVYYTQDNATTPVTYLVPADQTAQYDAWFDDKIGKGGFVDAPTSEAIVSVEFIKDQVIVYFERSTWKLVYTQNEALPFVFQKINTELGSESTFSIAPFDRGVFGVGNYGIITTNGVDVARLDQKIPDLVMDIQNQNDGVKRVHGIRDYTAQLVYWTYPSLESPVNIGVASGQTLTYPNFVLLYNYLEQSWAIFDDCFTCFGYYQRLTGKTWADITTPWEECNFAWGSGVNQSRYPLVVAGNQEGFVFVFSQLTYNGLNAPSLTISDFSGNTITSYNHNLFNGQYVRITEATGFTGANGGIYQVNLATDNTFQLNPNVNATGYTGGGVITRMQNFDITTKQFNPFYEQGDSCRLSWVDIYMDRTSNGEMNVWFLNSSNDSTATEEDVTLTSPEPPGSFSSTQDRIWHRIYANTYGSFFQNTFTLSDAQIRDFNISTSNIRIHALIYYVSPCGRISYDL